MSLSKIIEEIKQVKPFAEENVDEGPVQTLSARRGRKNQAIERMKTLKFEYRQNLIDSAAFIVVTGDKREAFASNAVENFKCFSADPNTFYEDLASRIPPTIYEGRESVSNLFDILGRHLEDKAGELGIIGYPQLIFKQQYRVTIKNKKDLVNLIRTAINEQVGSEMVGIQAVATILNPAIAREHKAKVTPIVLTVEDSSLAVELTNTLRRLRPRGTFLISAGKSKGLKNVTVNASVKDPTNETVAEALKSISGSTLGE